MSSIEQQQLTLKERHDIESRLSNYNIPLQILQIVGERCDCPIDTHIRINGVMRKPKASSLLSRLNDRTIRLLQQIFLDCHDSLSNFRLAVFLSTRYSPTLHQFVMDSTINGESGQKYRLDVCIYSRQTDQLVAVCMQNKNIGQRASRKDLFDFLSTISDLDVGHTAMQGAYYASSYGYEDYNNSSSRQARPIVKKTRSRSEAPMEIKFFEYKDKIYFENKHSSMQG